MHRPQHAVHAEEANDRSSRISTAITAQVASGSETISDTYSRASSAGDHLLDSTGLRALLDTELLNDFAHLSEMGRWISQGEGFPMGRGMGLGPLMGSIHTSLQESSMGADG